MYCPITKVIQCDITIGINSTVWYPWRRKETWFQERYSLGNFRRDVSSFFFFLICLCNDIIVVIFFWYDRIEDVDNINLEILPIFFYSSRDEHIPAKRLHTLSSIIVDLLEFSFKYLVVGGRLVYWLPVYKPRYAVKLYFYNDVYNVWCNT